MPHVHLFLSAVSNEFRTYRSALLHILDRPTLTVKIQEHLSSLGGVTLSDLDDYIRQCEAVVHLIGSLTGAVANQPSLEWLRAQYPDLPTRYPALREVLTGEVAASYTQWEAYLAIYHSKSLLVATPAPGVVSDEPQTAEPAADAVQSQVAHLARLRQLGYYPGAGLKFVSVDNLAANLLVSKLYDLAVAAGIAASGLVTALKPHTLPYLPLGTLFKGRAGLLQQLQQHWLATTGQPQALYGLGGIGKTRLAVEYAWQHRADYSALLFVRADTAANLEANLAALCGPLVLNLPEQSALEQELRLRAALNWLSRNHGWLLILDNVDTAEAAQAVEKWLPQFGAGHVLLTTRVSQWSRQLTRVELDVLLPTDAAAFLLERTEGHRVPTTADKAEALALAQDLGQLALALEQAGAYISTRPIALATYRQRWARNDRAVRSWFDERLMGYSSSVAITWLTSFQELTPAAQTLLNQLAWLAPTPLPLTLLEVAVPGTEPLDAEEALADLARYSLARYTLSQATFSVHQLVQEVTRGKLQGAARRLAFTEALGWVSAAFAGDPRDVRNWPMLVPLQPHALEVITIHASEFNNPEPTGRLINNVSQLLDAKAETGRAEPLMRQALVIIEAQYGPNHPAMATCLSNLALLLLATNRLSEAEPLFRRALAIDEASYGPDHPELATCLNNLAGLLQATNRLGEAEPLFRRALTIDEASLGPHHLDVARDLNNLALLLKATNRLGEAEPLFRRALTIDEASYGPDHPDVARGLNNLALLLQATNRLDEAEPLFRRALAITEASYDPDHPTVAICLNSLALLLQVTNRLGEAEPLFRRALTIDEASLGPHHPAVARDLNNLAGLLQATNRLGEAEPLFRRALTIDEVSLGPHHPDVARDLNNLALLLKATSRLKEAEPLFRRALAISEASYGLQHPIVATDLNNLAGLLQATNRLGEAEPLFRRALTISEASYGLQHSIVAVYLNNLAGLLLATNRLSEAEPLFRRALAITEASYGPDHPAVATCLNNLAGLLQATNRLEEAEHLFRRALTIDEVSLGPHHPDVARDLNNLALLLQATNRLGEAEPLFRRALTIDEVSFGPHHPTVARDLDNLALLLLATNRLGEAEPLFRRALAITEASYDPDHPTVAIRLNNLAGLLQTTNRLDEAEPLCRRAVGILVAFYHRTGHNHPHFKIETSNYIDVMRRLGRSDTTIRAALAAFGIRLGGGEDGVTT